jgi:hypothetical protein
VAIAQSLYFRNVRQSRREVAFKFPVVGEQKFAPTELKREIGIVGECRRIVVICAISRVDDLSFEFSPTIHNIFDQGCHVRIAEEFPSGILEIIADEKRKENSVRLEHKALKGQQ